MWCTFHFDLLIFFVSLLCLHTLVGGVTGPCIAQCASLSDTANLIVVLLETYIQTPSTDVETALFL